MYQVTRFPLCGTKGSLPLVRLLYSFSLTPGNESGEARSGREGGDHGGWARFEPGADMVRKLV